jgi:microcystin degradation protein MlrC
MKVVIAQMKHETNTFSPVPTPLARFATGTAVPPEGADAYAAYKGTGSGISAFIDLAEAAGAEIEMPIAASAWPSGPVEDAPFEHIASRICAAVARGCDAVLLDLHGAMVTQSHEDGEGELLRRVRAIAPRVPIGVALDMHTNLYPGMVDSATVIAGYQTYPHVDMFETGQRAGRAVFAMLAGRPRPPWPGATSPCCRTSCARAATTAPTRSCRRAAARWRRRARCRPRSSSAFPTPTSTTPACRRWWSPTTTPRWPAASPTSCSTWPGRRARSSSTGSSRWPTRWRARRSWRWTSSPAAARWCCWTTATTAPPAAPWTP